MLMIGYILRPVLGEYAFGIVGIVIVWVAVVELGWLSLGWPAARRQVPSAVVGKGSRLGPLQFGFEMGTGVRTFMPTPLPYVALAPLVLATGFGVAAAIGLGFGLGRAAMTVTRYYHPVSPDQWDTLLEKYLPSVRLASWLLASAAALALSYAPA